MGNNPDGLELEISRSALAAYKFKSGDAITGANALQLMCVATDVLDSQILRSASWRLGGIILFGSVGSGSNHVNVDVR